MVFILPVCLTWGPLHKSIRGPHLRKGKHLFGIFNPRAINPVILQSMHNYLYTVVVGVLTFSFRIRHLNLLYWEEKQHTYLLIPFFKKRSGQQFKLFANLMLWFIRPVKETDRSTDSSGARCPESRVCNLCPWSFEGPTRQAQETWPQCPRVWSHVLCMRLDRTPMEVPSNPSDAVILLMS